MIRAVVIGAVSLVGALMIFFTGLSVLFIAISLVTPSALLYYPSETAMFDFTLFLAAIAVVLGGILAGFLRWEAGRFQLGNRIALTFKRFTVRALAAFLLSASVIAIRFSPIWYEVRTGIRQYSAAIAADTGGGLVKSNEEFQLLQNKHVPKPVPLNVMGWGTVYLRMAHGMYPYVGIDFGEGTHAVFNPSTMLVMYAD